MLKPPKRSTRRARTERWKTRQIKASLDPSVPWYNKWGKLAHRDRWKRQMRLDQSDAKHRPRRSGKKGRRVAHEHR